jgi:hypothetical protein
MLRLDGDTFTPYFSVPILPVREKKRAMVRKNLEFEIRWQLRELIREQGAAVVMYGVGKKLLQNLEAIEALKAAKQAA